MFKTTLKNLWARKLRLVTTGLAVFLGVAFMAGTFVLSDTVERTFNDLFADVNEGTDAYVRSEATVSTEFGEDQRARVEAGLVDQVRAVDGVAAAEGSIQGYAQLVDKQGDKIGNPNNGPPTFGGNWPTVEELNPFRLAEGRPPEADDEVVIDRASAKNNDLVVGDRIQVLVQAGAPEVEIVGIARFGTADSPGGATYTLFTEPAAQELVAKPDRFDAVQAVAEEGVTEQELRDRIAAEVPAGIEVLTGQQITEEDQDDIQQFVSFISSFFLVFAVIALFVGTFIIYNTFSILVAQRTREMALLRAVGASRRQVLGSVLLEAALIGLVASLLGVVAGIGMAVALKGLMSAIGFEIPSGGLVLTSATVINSVIVGLVVAVVAAWYPARRASKVPPIAAMRDVAVERTGTSWRRMAVGVVLTAGGAAALLYGLFANLDNPLAPVALGAVFIFIGVAVLGPVIARPVSRALGAPLPSLRGVTGRLARDNATRNPRRTAATAAALMIGVALVGLVTILAASTTASIESIVDDTLTGDFVVDSGGFGFGGLNPAVAARLNELPEVEAASAIRVGYARIAGEDRGLAAIDPATAEQVFDLGVLDGGLDALDEDGIALHREVAEEEGLAVGDELPAQFIDTGEQNLTVAATYEEDQFVGDYLVGYPLFERNFADQLDGQIYVLTADGVSPGQARAAIESVTDDFPNAEVQDNEEFKEAQTDQFRPILALIYALLLLSVVIALFGIANTLALSIFERTRELGLLRAVGMTRAQLRSAVRWESVIIALLGTFLGLVIGLFFGWAVVEALSDEGLQFRVPVGQLVVVCVIAALAGVIAAVVPGIRASRLDVLRAVTTE